MGTIVCVILGGIVGAILWSTYHKMFNVAYFSAGAIFKEIAVCFIFGVAIVNAILSKLLGL